MRAADQYEAAFARLRDAKALSVERLYELKGEGNCLVTESRKRGREGDGKCPAAKKRKNDGPLDDKKGRTYCSSLDDSVITRLERASPIEDEGEAGRMFAGKHENGHYFVLYKDFRPYHPPEWCEDPDICAAQPPSGPCCPQHYPGLMVEFDSDFKQTGMHLLRDEDYEKALSVEVKKGLFVHLARVK